MSIIEYLIQWIGDCIKNYIRIKQQTYPLMNLISTDNPNSFVGGVSATSVD
ncbi:hypothetical protein Plhal304r1_c032g0102671 [Plasmopara halstedii]